MRRILQSAVVLVTTALSSFAEVQLHWTDKYVEARNVPALSTNLSLKEWQRLFSVRAEQGTLVSDLTLPPMAGKYETPAPNIIRFQPSFPLQPNVTYRATFRPPDGKPISVAHRISGVAVKATTTVKAIYPTDATLPENLLKFYIHFTGPMSAGHIYDYIHLLDAKGNPVELPFLEIDEELWNPEMTRLTLFLDPGRIKRGVKPLEEIGPSFQAGKSYKLFIRKEWLDAHGAELKANFEKKFTVTEPDRDPPDPAKWKMTSPKAGTREGLILTFNEPMDHAIAERTIRIVNSKGETIPGKNEIAIGEQKLLFTPDREWASGEFAVIIPTRIEDLAGNNIGKPFDVDLAKEDRALTIEKVRLPFQVR